MNVFIPLTALPDIPLWIFAVIGIGCVIGFLIFCSWYVYNEFKNWLSRLRWKRTYKHRFDKPPTAACYCMDCRKWDRSTGRCYKFDGWHTADNWFCWDADPREQEPKEEVK